MTSEDPGAIRRAMVSRTWIGLIGILLLPAVALADSQPWDPIADEDGIKVWQRDVEGSSFVEFRGRGVVNARILDVAAVIRGVDREAEWMHSCAGGRTVAFRSATEAVVYNRTASPFFLISDRDTVLLTKFVPDEKKKTITVSFHNVEHRNMPPVDGVVRMPKLDGHWRLTKIAPDKTEVEYQVAADPGGALPAWLVNMASKDLPLQTIEGLRKQVRAKGYDQDRLVLERVLDGTCFVAEGSSASPKDEDRATATKG